MDACGYTGAPAMFYQMNFNADLLCRIVHKYLANVVQVQSNHACDTFSTSCVRDSHRFTIVVLHVLHNFCTSFGVFLWFGSPKCWYGFQGQFLGDLGVEFMPGCNAQICWKHSKYKCVHQIWLCWLLGDFSVTKIGFGISFWRVLGYLGYHFGGFWRS